MSQLNQHLQLRSMKAQPDPMRPYAKWLSVVLLLLGGSLLAACTIQLPVTPATPAPTRAPSKPPPDTFGGLVQSIDDYTLPIPVPTLEPDTTVVINTGGSRANVRSGPGLDFSIIGKAVPGEVFAVRSRSVDNQWWEVCCIPGATADAAETNGWLANSVVRPGNEDEVPVTEQLLDQTLTAQWEVDWQCGSERCEVKECSAEVNASVSRAPEAQLLAIEHQVTWADTCFATDEWVFDVNQFSGQERTGEYENNFLYGYWLGRGAGEANGAYTLEDGQTVAVTCSGPHTVEIEEGGGWTTAYEGNTCHDARTGMLVLLSYNKRWLFTGEFEGETYERAYFGDNETLNQRLVDTTVELEFVEER